MSITLSRPISRHLVVLSLLSVSPLAFAQYSQGAYQAPATPQGSQVTQYNSHETTHGASRTCPSQAQTPSHVKQTHKRHAHKAPRHVPRGTYQTPAASRENQYNTYGTSRNAPQQGAYQAPAASRESQGNQYNTYGASRNTSQQGAYQTPASRGY